MDMNNDSDRLAKRLSNAFRNAVFDTGAAVCSSLMTIGTAVSTQNVIVTFTAGAIAAGFTMKAMGAFSMGLEKPLPEEAQLERPSATPEPQPPKNTDHTP